MSRTTFRFSSYFFIFCSLISVSVSYNVFVSFRQQYPIITEYNLDTNNLPLSFISNVQSTLPSITVTTIPLNGIKAFYYFKAKQYDSAIFFSRLGLKSNPFIGFNQAIIADSYLQKGNIDSALHYSKQAYSALPENIIHQDVLIRCLAETGSVSDIRKVFLDHKQSKHIVLYYRFLSEIIKLKDFDPENDLVFAKEARELFPDNEEISAMYSLIQNGVSNVIEANKHSDTALDFYEKKDFNNALKYFKRAEILLPNEQAYKENIATTFLQLKDYDSALRYYDIVIDSLNPKTGKPEYLKGYLYLLSNKRDSACLWFLKSFKLKNQIGTQLHEQYCQN